MKYREVVLAHESHYFEVRNSILYKDLEQLESYYSAVVSTQKENGSTEHVHNLEKEAGLSSDE